MKAPTMGMDVYGKNPKNEAGEYFRNNVWHWRPLATLCNRFAPAICAKCQDWETNEGYGLDEAGSLALADALTQRIEDGAIQRYIENRDAWLAKLPDEVCRFCNGTGTRTDEIARAAGMMERVITEAGHPRQNQTGWCNACDGRGTVRPLEAHYPCTLENVEAFVAFLSACGGFEIH